jgi:hypothetical protein
MQYFDVFNGDADGICALVQLRNAEPRDSQLITGVKRDIALLKQVAASEGDQVTVLDVSMDKNKDALLATLDAGAQVFYCDHHFAGDIPEHPGLTSLVNTEPTVCTSLLINGHLNGRFKEWAVTATFGDNLRNSALALAKQCDLSEAQVQQLENLGIYINYNGYGPSVADLHFAPDELYRQLLPYSNPLDYIGDPQGSFATLEAAYNADMAAARAVKFDAEFDCAAVLTLPNETWARRVSGVYGNELANEYPDRAHAVLTENKDGTYTVSVRAPLSNREGADELCMQFPTGGGRKAAAGINALPADQINKFIDALKERYSR